jgi:transcriptional regulator with XRE-family HTH domain
VVDESIGHRIKERRVALGLSQESLAAALGVARQQVQKYEGGVNRLSVSRLVEVAAVLRAPVGWFFRDLETHPLRQHSQAIAALFDLDEVLANPSARSKQPPSARELAASSENRTISHNPQASPPAPARRRRKA